MRLKKRVSDRTVIEIRLRRAQQISLTQLAEEFAPISRSTIYQIIEQKGPYADWNEMDIPPPRIGAPKEAPREATFGLPPSLRAQWEAKKEKVAEEASERPLLLSEELERLRDELNTLIVRVREMESTGGN